MDKHPLSPASWGCDDDPTFQEVSGNASWTDVAKGFTKHVDVSSVIKSVIGVAALTTIYKLAAADDEKDTPPEDKPPEPDKVDLSGISSKKVDPSGSTTWTVGLVDDKQATPDDQMINGLTRRFWNVSRHSRTYEGNSWGGKCVIDRNGTVTGDVEFVKSMLLLETTVLEHLRLTGKKELSFQGTSRDNKIVWYKSDTGFTDPKYVDYALGFVTLYPYRHVHGSSYASLGDSKTHHADLSYCRDFGRILRLLPPNSEMELMSVRDKPIAIIHPQTGIGPRPISVIGYDRELHVHSDALLKSIQEYPLENGVRYTCALYGSCDKTANKPSGTPPPPVVKNIAPCVDTGYMARGAAKIKTGVINPWMSLYYLLGLHPLVGAMDRVATDMLMTHAKAATMDNPEEQEAYTYLIQTAEDMLGNASPPTSFLKDLGQPVGYGTSHFPWLPNGNPMKTEWTREGAEDVAQYGLNLSKYPLPVDLKYPISIPDWRNLLKSA